ncbi:hypothetical protein V565_087470 [Rhizoctonia solani 123E]|uniref:Uncharacterized protein n=1 Tax=Rhizoctonia solani 123E TaxID=1423351 RepID=A0A074SJ54_9AGAM|nr:hypothetical protein V565_087470 [Rhizoctonia solani 123E]
MASSLFKSLSLGVSSVQQVIYAPSNFGFEVDVIRVPNNPTSGHNPSSSTDGHASNNQVHPYLSASYNAQRSGIDRRATGDFMLLTRHRNWLPCAVPEYQEAYPQRMRRCSIVSPISSEPDDWVVVNANLSGSESHV